MRVWEKRPVKCIGVETSQLTFNYITVQVLEGSVYVRSVFCVTLMFVTGVSRELLQPCIQALSPESVLDDPPE